MNQAVCYRSLLAFAALAGLLSACAEKETVSFAADVQPLLQANCIGCHQAGGEGFETSGFSMTSYEGLMRGTEGGPMVIAGDSLGSNLLVLIEGRADPTLTMPRDQHVLRAHEIDLIRTWIEEGAKNN